MTIDVLLARIAELWNAERCDWTLHYEPTLYGAGRPGSIVYLTWVDDGWSNVQHGATDVAYTWEFADESAVQAFADAVDWLEQLATWRRCDECDGLGYWNGKPCEHCNHTGLATVNA